ncbi:MAG TPA: GntR family transcriptional regulator [Syntrophorhabdaceae bacterium]|jgi:DNA-binding GntR family transcriptional regulator
MKQRILEEQLTIRKKVYHYIREKILTGAIAPNERLVETKIAGEIGTSRTPIREALHNLEIEKLVKSIPRVGYVVESMSAEDLEQICELREAIEVLAARRALERSHKRLAKELAANVTRQEQAIAAKNLNVYIDLDTKFHETIARLSGSDRVYELVQTLRRHMLRYSMYATRFVETALHSMEGHKTILRAIEKGDVDVLAQAIRDHLDKARNDIVHSVFSTEYEND